MKVEGQGMGWTTRISGTFHVTNGNCALPHAHKQSKQEGRGGLLSKTKTKKEEV